MPTLSRFFFAYFLFSWPLAAEPWTDPAPPKTATLTEQAPPAPQAFDRLTFHQAPKPLNKTAVTSEWTRFLGPNHDATSPETHLLHEWPKEELTPVWEVKKGDSYTSPAIAGDFLVLFHALDKKETIECLHPETGQRYWSYDYPMEYRDRYGFANGPRGSPVIADDHIITLGVTSVLTCLELKTGRLIWQRDLKVEFGVPQDFFGQGSTPLILDGRVIVNVGGKTTQLCVGAFDLKTGVLLWGTKDEWTASYASPVPATLHGQPVVLVFAGGESDPASGGLLCINPKDGTVHDRFPWRADDYISVNAASPVVIAEKNRVFVSTSYPKGRPIGGVMVEFDEKLKAKEVWQSKKIAIHWMNPLYKDGYLYAVDGETERIARLVCVDANTGVEQWRKDLAWEDTELSPGKVGNMSAQRASLLMVDGRCLCLGELGSLLWLNLSPEDCKIEARTQLFYAPHTWCLPAVRKGLLYVMQNYEEQVRGKTGQRMLCYDLRAP